MKYVYYSLLLLFIIAYSTSAQNYSLNFDGNSYVSIPHSDSLNLGNQLTIECWYSVQGSSLGDWIGMVCKMDSNAVPGSGYFFGLGQSSTYPNWLWFVIYPSNNQMSYSFSSTLNQWHNLAVTYNGSIMKMFLDGNLIQQASSTSLIGSNNFPLTIGGESGNWWHRNLNGKIDEVRISSIARYDTNFVPTIHFDNDIYTRVLYHFNEGTGNTVYDSSGNNNNGTIYGATWSIDVPTTVQEEAMNKPDKFMLSQNYPNPFNPSTTIQFDLPKASFVTLKVYNILGQEVATLVNEKREVESYEVKFDGSNLTSGVYYYRLIAGDIIETKKFILVK